MKKRILTLIALTIAVAMQLSAANSGDGKDYLVAAYIWPSCHDDSLAHKYLWSEGIGEWEIIKQGDPRFEGHYQPKRPLWGYEMDDDPSVVEKWIQTALSYGVNTFVYDWYWFKEYPYLEGAIDNGFLKAPSCRKMNFYVMWANHNVIYNYWNYHRYGDNTDLLFDPDVDWANFKKIVARIISQYFCQPNYVKINGCPVMSIYSMDNLKRSFGGSYEETRKAIDYFRAEAKKAGYPDIYLMETFGGGPNVSDKFKASETEKIQKLGIDAVSFYNMGGFNTDYAKHCENAEKIRAAWDGTFGVPVFPCVSIGWDPTPRFPKKGADDVTRFNHTPEVFAAELQKCKDYVDAHPNQPKILTINAWNEWVEGSYLLPDEVYGFSFLEAVRKVMGTEHCKKSCTLSVQTKSAGEVKINCPDQGDWTFKADVSSQGGREFIKVTMDAPCETAPEKFTVSFSIPQNGISNLWAATGSTNKQLRADWSANYSSQLASGMPLYSFLGTDGKNRLTVATNETFRKVNAKMGLREEGCNAVGQLSFFVEPESNMSHYETIIMLDGRDEAWYDGVREGAAWITDAAGLKPLDVPEAAFDPLYSSWYQFHQNLHAADIEAECALASQLGMKNIIIDDGWQTDDTNRGYAYCGDWQVSKNRFPDMKAHVDKVHALGMKYMMWYAVPFVGFKSQSYSRFKDKALSVRESMSALVLDPRFPEVRDYLAGIYEKAMLEWGLDGFKLDFIDSFTISGTDPALADNYAGRDIKSVPEAVDVLMKEIVSRLKKINPNVLIEFRQSYIGPAIRQYGNMLRAGDCPGDRMKNRISISDLRLTSGNTAVHADMLEWNLAESPETAALNIISSIFGTVQYSVMLRDIPEQQKAVIKNWLQFSQDHRETLLKSDFRPMHPELSYPVIEAESAAEKIVGVYEDSSVAEASADKTTWIMNGTMSESLFVNLQGKPAKAVAYDAFGSEKGTVKLKAGCTKVSIPSGGRLRIR